MTNCLLIFVVLSLISLGLGESPLVILSICSLVLSFVISSLLFSVCFLVSFSFFLFVSFSVLFVLPYVFMRQFLEYTSFLIIKKKIKKNCYFRPLLNLFCKLIIFHGIRALDPWLQQHLKILLSPHILLIQQHLKILLSPHILLINNPSFITSSISIIVTV